MIGSVDLPSVCISFIGFLALIGIGIYLTGGRRRRK